RNPTGFSDRHPSGHPAVWRLSAEWKKHRKNGKFPHSRNKTGRPLWDLPRIFLWKSWDTPVKGPSAPATKTYNRSSKSNGKSVHRPVPFACTRYSIRCGTVQIREPEVHPYKVVYSQTSHF